MSLPGSIEAVDGAWLSSVMREDVELAGAPERLSSYACEVYRLRLAASTSAPAGVVVKLPVTGPIRQLIDGLGIYQREVTFYERVARVAPLRTPRAYVAEMAAEGTDFALVLEDLSPLTAGDQLAGLTRRQVEIAIDELARFHAWAWETAELGELAEAFPPIDSPIGRAMQDQWGQFFALAWPAASALAAEAVGDELQAFARQLPELVPAFVDALARPRTLTHGDYRADNLIFDGDGRPYVVDFQNVQQECGLRELAYFLVQSLTVEQRRGNDEALVRRYWDGLIAAGVAGFSFEDAWRSYRLAVAHVLVLPVVACMRYEAADDRGKQLLVEMIRRGAAAIEDNGSLALVRELPQ
jgi:hypothetical protein